MPSTNTHQVKSQFSIKDLLLIDKNLLFSSGNAGANFSKISSPQESTSESIVYCSSSKNLKELNGMSCSILVVPKDCINQLPDNISREALLTSTHPQASFALGLSLFAEPSPEAGVHPTAFVHPTAKIHPSSTIGPFCNIEAEAVIGEKTALQSHVHLGRGAKTGAHCKISAFVDVGHKCELKDRVIIHSGTVIGSDGFGFQGEPGSPPVKVPQVGIVVVDNDVEIGANCSIDRATIGTTYIGENTKFDNLCHVAHNCKIGKNNRIAAGFFIAGSSEIGDGCMFGGGVLIADHVKLGSNIFVGGSSCITKDVLTAGAYTGYPLEPLKDGLKTLANLRHLTEMRATIAGLKNK